MSETDKENGRPGIQVISRAARILRALKDSPSGMSLGQIAEKVDLPRSTVQRITGALAAENFVISDPKGHGLRLGQEFGALAGSARFDIVEHCRPLLTDLTRMTEETADLAVLRGAGMVFLDQVPGTHRLTTVSKVGEAFPLTTTANGRACLAELPEETALKFARNEWDRDMISQDPVDLMGALVGIRETGLAYDLDEHTPGIWGIGFAFRDWGGELHAISVAVPSTRLDGSRDRIERSLRKTKTEIETSFSSGGRDA